MRIQLLQILLLILAFLSSPAKIRAQFPKPSNAEGMRIELTKYPRIVDVRDNFITIDQGADYWIAEGQIIEIWKFHPTSESGSGQEPIGEKVGQARITAVGVQTSTAQVLGEQTTPINVEDVVRIHPEVVQAGTGQITIDRGINQGLVAGWVVTIWRFEPVDSATSPNITPSSSVRKIVGRAILTDVQPDTATARILGKPFDWPSSGDFIRVDKQTTVRQKSGRIVYLNVATDLINTLKPGMSVYAFRSYTLMHPDGSGRVIRWEERIATLKISHVAPASYTARAVLENGSARDVLPDDLILLEDIQAFQKMKAYQDIHVLKTAPGRIYLNRFEEAREGTQLTIVRKQPMSDEIDPVAPISTLQVEAVYDQVVIAVFLSRTDDSAFRVGDTVRYAVYH